MFKPCFIESDRVTKEHIANDGNRFLIGNLHLGIRGTLDEYKKEEMVGLNLPFIYDQYQDQWREPINVPNPIYAHLVVNGKRLHVLEDYFKHHQSLDISTGVFSRTTVFHVDDIEVTFHSERFVSETLKRTIYVSYQITTNKRAHVEFVTGIDGNIWEINGPHLSSYTWEQDQHVLKLSTETRELKRWIGVEEETKAFFNHDVHYDKTKLTYMRTFVFDTEPHDIYHLEKVAYIFVDEKEPSTFQTYEEAYQEQIKSWQHKWDIAEVKVIGNEEANKALNYSIYHLLMLTPIDENTQSIPARGISGQTYKGAVFWDTEMFLLPFFLNVNPKAARSIVEYRIHTLEGAIAKAKSYGYKGAFYPWESQEKGIEACTDYNVTDVFTHRLVRTYFRDKQIHISADVVFGIWSYYKRTNDISILVEGGADVILACARFYQDYSYYHFNKKRSEFLDVLGPDEYHERVNNNAFTNRMIKFVFDVLRKTDTLLKTYDPSFYQQWSTINTDDVSVQDLILFGETIYVKEPLGNGLIEQFDGYMSLRDISLKELLSKRLHPNEYLGGHGLAGDTKIIKQADVITMLYLFQRDYSVDVMKTNFDYYEPKTEHGSSLSASMYALVSCLIGEPNYAYPLFMKSASVDLTGQSKTYAGGIYIGGSHPAAAGGAYMTAIYGFAGLELNDEHQMAFNSHLPDNIEGLSFSIRIKQDIYRVEINRQQVTIKKEKASD